MPYVEYKINYYKYIYIYMYQTGRTLHQCRRQHGIVRVFVVALGNFQPKVMPARYERTAATLWAFPDSDTPAASHCVKAMLVPTERVYR